jgi:hypothetical protein
VPARSARSSPTGSPRAAASSAGGSVPQGEPFLRLGEGARTVPGPRLLGGGRGEQQGVGRVDLVLAQAEPIAGGGTGDGLGTGLPAGPRICRTLVGFSGRSSGHSPSTGRPAPHPVLNSPANSDSRPRSRGAVISRPRWETTDAASTRGSPRQVGHDDRRLTGLTAHPRREGLACAAPARPRPPRRPRSPAARPPTRCPPGPWRRPPSRRSRPRSGWRPRRSC